MRYLVSVIDHETGAATPAEMAAIDAFNARMRAEGRFVLACGLEAPSAAVVIDHRGAAATFTPGPLVTSDEYVSGFWVLEAASPDEARALAAEASRCCNRKVELRALWGG